MPVYLDNAATSYPKAPGVAEAVARCIESVGGSPGRGGHAGSRAASAIADDCRRRLARLLHAENASRIAFALNATDALNLLLKGAARAAGTGARIVTTALEHNAVARPLRALSRDGVEIVRVDADPDTGLVAASSLCHALTPNTTAVCLSMVGSVTGAIQPIAEIAAACRDRGVLCIVDAAQAVGHVPIDVGSLGLDALAFSGHKGLLGPAGVGGLYVREGIEHRFAVTREGGSGSGSESPDHPHEMPARFEAGTPNTPGLSGLAAALAWIDSRGVASIREHERALVRHLLDALHTRGVRHPAWTPRRGPLSTLRVLGPADDSRRTAIVSLAHDSISADEMEAVLDSSFGIAARGGLACAPEAHAALGSRGALRLSPGVFTTIPDIDHAVGALVAACAV